MEILRVDNVSKCYFLYDKPYQRFAASLFPGKYKKGNEFWAVRNASFTLSAGETLGIIGKNGAGKSTLLQMICKTLTPTEGGIDVKGRVAALLELGAGFNEDFTGRENVYLNAAIYGLSKEEVNQRLERILAFADIGQFIDQPVKTYSSGMYVRLAFSIVAHVDADLLVIDEALAVGDALFSQKCMRFLEEFKKKGSIVFVSHNSSAVLQLCNKVIWMEKGSVKREGKARDVVESYMESLYEDKQGSVSIASRSAEGSGNIDGENEPPPAFEEHWYDVRSDFLKTTDVRNEVELYKFDGGSKAFGSGLVKIEDVYFKFKNEKRANFIIGGEKSYLDVEFQALCDMENVIVGFLVKNRLGQVLFGENNLFFGPGETVARGEKYRAQYEFFMPYLVPDDYVLTIGIASGTQEEHIQHHWIHDALVFTVHSSHLVHGLFGVPVTGFRLDKKKGQDNSV